MEKFLLEFQGFVHQCRERGLYDIDYVALFRLYKETTQPAQTNKISE